MDECKKYIKKGEDLVIVADKQSNGRGTKNRSFSSNQGGIYLSVLKFYDNLLAKDAFSIVRHYSIALIKTLLAFDISGQIKWPNDILVNGKKICGILTENKISDGKIVYSIIGIGLNVENQLELELKDIAVTMKDIVGNVNFESVLNTLLYNLTLNHEVGLYNDYSCVLGKEVTIIQGENEFVSTVVDILDDGRIVLESGQVLASAEIKLSVR